MIKIVIFITEMTQWLYKNDTYNRETYIACIYINICA